VVGGRRHALRDGLVIAEVAMAVVLLATAGTFNLPSEPIFILLGVDALIDMARTAVNVTGNCLASAVIARWEGGLEEPKSLDAPVI